MLPRSLPTSPTSPTAAASASPLLLIPIARRDPLITVDNDRGRYIYINVRFAAPRRISQTPKDDSLPSYTLLQAAIYPAGFSAGMAGVAGAIGQVTSPFASSDSLTNDVTRDHSDGIWNESQATVLQADSLALLTPSSRRRHLLLLQHQQRSSMDTEALDVEDEAEPCPPPSPRIRLEPATPVQALAPRYTIRSFPSPSFMRIACVRGQRSVCAKVAHAPAK